MGPKSIATLLVFVPLGFLAAGSPEQLPRYSAVRVDSAPRIDGVLDDACWAREATFELRYQFRPGENELAPVATRFWIAYDSVAFYVAVRADDPEPEKIRARYTDRDRAFDDDLVGISLDTFADERRAYELFVNPLGVQIDSIRDDVTDREDSSWDGLWESAGKIDSQGYSVEFAIPWSTLRFPPTQADRFWRVNAFRAWPREHRYQLSLVSIDRNRGCFLCQAARLEGLVDIPSKRGLELAPTLVTLREERLGQATQESAEGGLTIRWALSSDITLQGAWNPDFSQVETDALQLDINTRFALFYPEKRPLFLESSEIFFTRSRAIYTRAISDPLWALRLTGKRNQDAFGLVLGQDQSTNLLLPGPEGSRLASLAIDNQFSIFRYRRDLPLSGSTLGVLYTSREAEDYHNRLGGFDLFLRPRDSHSIRVEALASKTRYPENLNDIASLEREGRTGYSWRTAYNFNNSRWETYVVYEHRTPEFRADLGFIPQVDIDRWVVGAFRVFRRDGTSWFNEIFVGGDIDETRDTRGNLLEQESELRITYQGPRQSRLEVGPRYRRTVLASRPLEEIQLDLYGQIRPTGALGLSAGATFGDRVDAVNVREGRGWQAEAGFHWTPGRRWSLALDSTAERLDLPEGRLFEAWIFRLRAEYRPDLRTGIRWIGQWVAIERDPELYPFAIAQTTSRFTNQLLLSWKLKPQTVAFLGISENSVGQGIDRVDLQRTQRTVFLKLGYSWNPF